MQLEKLYKGLYLPFVLLHFPPLATTYDDSRANENNYNTSWEITAIAFTEVFGWFLCIKMAHKQG